MAAQDEEDRGGFFGGYTSGADMIDGGGKGRSGARFEGGGLLSDFANMVATPRGSYGADTGQRRPVARPSVASIDAARQRANAPYSFGRDLLDGGGLGRRATLAEINSGRGFRGGVPSMIANMVGIRPMGANDLGLVASYDAALASRSDVLDQMQRNNVGGGGGGGGGSSLLANPVRDALETISLSEIASTPTPTPTPEVTQKYLDLEFLDPIRASLNAPAALLTRGPSTRPVVSPNEINMRVPVYEHMTDPSKDVYEGDESYNLAREVYENDSDIRSMEEAYYLVTDEEAYNSYLAGNR